MTAIFLAIERRRVRGWALSYRRDITGGAVVDVGVVGVVAYPDAEMSAADARAFLRAGWAVPEAAVRTRGGWASREWLAGRGCIAMRAAGGLMEKILLPEIQLVT